MQWEVGVRLDDYRKKQTKKAGPFLTLPCSFTIDYLLKSQPIHYDSP